MVIAIDGEAGSGKTSLARKLAEKLGFHFLATGNIYRAVTAYVISEHKKDESKPSEDIVKGLKNSDIYFNSKEKTVTLKGEVYKDSDLMTEEISREVSQVAQIGYVRKIINSVVKKVAEGKNVVVEGRDMTSVVFPEAAIKFYVQANLDKRAKRRYKAQKKSGKLKRGESISSIKEALAERDKQDKDRAIGPLIKVADAFVIHNDSEFENTLETMLSIITNHPKYKKIEKRAPNRRIKKETK